MINPIRAYIERIVNKRLDHYNEQVARAIGRTVAKNNEQLERDLIEIGLLEPGENAAQLPRVNGGKLVDMVQAEMKDRARRGR